MFFKESYLDSLRAKLQFSSDWFETRFVGNPEDMFSCGVASYLGSSRTHITSATDNNILKQNNEEAIHQIWALSRENLSSGSPTK